MSQDVVLETIRRNVIELLPDVEPNEVQPDRSLTDLGCNSIDRADIVTMSMEQLGIHVPINEFADVRDIGSLAELLRRHVA